MGNKKRFRCLTSLIIAGISLTALLSAVFYFYLGPNLLAKKRAAAAPPRVTVHTPPYGETVPAGKKLTASATAISQNPIARLEVWLDGEKFGEQFPPVADNSFYASFEISMAEGEHSLFFRAVDQAGLVGQSLPRYITGTPDFASLATEEGQSLGEIADALGVPQEKLKELNPGIDDGGLPAGTNVKVPAPPPHGGGANANQPPGGNADPGSQPGGGGDPGPGAGGAGNGAPSDAPPDTTKAYEVQPIGSPVITPGDFISALISSRPEAPSSLYAEYSDCVVKLHWQDNADNETHFNIWMQRVQGPPQLIATTPDNPLNGPTLYKFKSPIFGFYSFWVEAANAVGSQPSEAKEVYVSDKNCGGNLATALEIEALDMYVYGPHKQIYCYLSLEGSDYRRIPEGSGVIEVQNNWGDITKYWGGEKRIQYVMPADEELTIEGSCMAQYGPLLVIPLPSFTTSVPREKWDGSRLEIKTESFLVGFRVQPLGPETAQGAFEYIDFGLNPPEIWNVDAEGELQIPEKDWKARTVTLSWHWQGDPDEITNFLILIDGEGYRHIDKTRRQETILMGSACGQKYAFQMVAVGPGGARSAPSNSFPYEQPPCPVMAEVHFLTVISNATDDTDCIPPFMNTCLPYTAGSCDPIGVAYDLWAEGAGHKRVTLEYGQYVAIRYECGIEYQFGKQLGANPDKIIIPVDPSNPEIRFGTTFWEDDDHGNDIFGKTDYPVRYDFNEWPSVDQVITLTTPFSDDTADATIKVRVRGFAYAGGSWDLYSP